MADTQCVGTVCGHRRRLDRHPVQVAPLPSLPYPYPTPTLPYPYPYPTLRQRLDCYRVQLPPHPRPLHHHAHTQAGPARSAAPSIPACLALAAPGPSRAALASEARRAWQADGTGCAGRAVPAIDSDETGRSRTPRRRRQQHATSSAPAARHVISAARHARHRIVMSVCVMGRAGLRAGESGGRPVCDWVPWLPWAPAVCDWVTTEPSMRARAARQLVCGPGSETVRAGPAG